MSTFRVPVTKILSIEPHPNADRLALAKVYDWQVVVPKDEFSSGAAIIYLPVDSILPQDLENRIFGPDSKIKLDKHRVRSIKIRGQISQGLIVNWVDAKIGPPEDFSLEQDIKDVLGVTKYEPPVRELPKHMQVKKKKVGNSNFKKYTDIENFKYYDRTLQDGEQVYVSEKLHGTSFRAGWVKPEANTVWKKIKKFFGALPEYTFCYGSRTVEISSKPTYKGFYGQDVYGQMVDKYNLQSIIPYGRTIYGEIIGPDIQKNYSYGLKELELYVYDIMDNNEKKWLDYPAFNREVNNMGLKPVPKLYVGPYSKSILEQLRDGSSIIDVKTPREGIVIKTIPERSTGSLGRVALKFISDAYYLARDNSDFH